MDELDVTRHRKMMVWGLFLMVLGSIFLLLQLDLMEIPSFWRLWPVVFFVLGITDLLDRRPGAAVEHFLVGSWFMACSFHWMGLTYFRSWPLLLVAVGTGMVLKTLTGEDRKRRHPGGAS